MPLATFVALGIGCDEQPNTVRPPAPVTAPIEASTPPAVETPVEIARPRPPVVDTAQEMYVVATRRGPIALMVGYGVELAFGGVEPITLRKTEPLVREPRFLEGLPALVAGLDAPVVDLVKFGGRWPNEATLVARVRSEYGEGMFTRTLRWNGSAWERDDPVVRLLKRYLIPIGPFELGTTLMLPAVEHTSPGKRGWIEALENAKPTQLVRRLVDGTTTPGPTIPAEEHSRYASTRDGWVFAGVQRVSMWSPDANAWQTTELPDAAGPWISGFVAVAKDDVYVYGLRGLDRGETRGGYIAHYDGKTWQAMPAPNCSEGVTRFAPARPTSWAYCVNENYEPRRPPMTRELWRTEANGEWQRVALALDAATSRVRIEVLGSSGEPPIDAARPRATDVAVTADGTVWLSMSEHDGIWHEEPGTWTLARSSAAGAVLLLPSDVDLHAPAKK